MSELDLERGVPHYSGQCGGMYPSPANTWVATFDLVGTATIYQDIPIPWDAYRTDFDLQLHLKSVGTPNPYDHFKVTIRNPSTNQVLETVADITPAPSSYFCQSVGFPIAGDYRGQTIRLHVQSTISNPGTAYYLDAINLWLNP